MKTLKKLIQHSLYILLACVLLSCGRSTTGCYKSVSEAYPEAIDIKPLIGQDWEFIVLDADSTIWFVQTMNITNTEVSSTQKIFELGNTL